MISRYDIEAIRQQVKKRLKREKDPTEFRPDKAKDGQTIKYRFYVLPPIQEGDTICDSKQTSKHSMSLFCLQSGVHWIENKQLGCPRVVNEEDCEICTYAFDLMKDIPAGTEVGKAERSKVRKALLPGEYSKVNIYFVYSDTNPESLRGQVLWFNAPKTVVDIWMACLYRDDDGGDPEEPLAYGVFFDEMCAPQFQLECTKNGDYNDYKTSKFLTSKKRPIALLEDGSPDLKRIKLILAKRHNLFEKMPEVDHAEIRRIAANLAGKGVPVKNFDQDENVEPAKTKTKAKSEVSDERPVQSKKPKNDDDKPQKIEQFKKQRDDDDDEKPPKQAKPKNDDDDQERTDTSKSSKKSNDDDDEKPQKKQQQMHMDDDDKLPKNEKQSESSSDVDDEVDRLLGELDKD